MELATQVPGVIRQFTDFNVNTVGRLPCKAHSCLNQRLLEIAIKLVSMAVPFIDLRFTVGLTCQTAFSELARIGAKSHRAPQFINALQLAQFIDDAVWRP